jgi:hypothetical protein
LFALVAFFCSSFSNLRIPSSFTFALLSPAGISTGSYSSFPVSGLNFFIEIVIPESLFSFFSALDSLYPLIFSFPVLKSFHPAIPNQ